jgi:regulator of nucleoside diphosphate kinase
MRTMFITNADVGRLKLLLGSAKQFLTKNHTHLQVLEEALARAEVVSPENIPPDVITMNSQFRIHELDVGRHAVYTLVFPGYADVAKNKISVLAPFGSALLGYRVGDLIVCAARGATKRVRVKEMVYQPNATRQVA